VAAALGFLFVVVMPSAVGWFVWQGLPPQKDVTVFASAFGDIVGPLFAALAFAGLIYTALMQREELSLQREELRETRGELRRTADAQEASGQVLREQVIIAQLVARLNAATALLGYYDHLASQIPLHPKTSVHIQQRKDVKARREELFEDINNLRNELRGAVTAKGFAVLPELTASGTGTTTDPDI
jgi:hypothetical protein